MSNKSPSVDALKSQKQTYDSIRPDKLSYRMTKLVQLITVLCPPRRKVNSVIQGKGMDNFGNKRCISNTAALSLY